MQEATGAGSTADGRHSVAISSNKRYDYLEHERASASTRLVLAILPLTFLSLGLSAILTGAVDNPPGLASSALPYARNIAMNPGAWLGAEFWYAPTTPSPLYYTGAAIIIKLFGYESRWVMTATCSMAAIAGYAIGLLSYARFGVAAALLAQLLTLFSPVSVTYSLSAAYYLWAVQFCLLGLVSLDRYVSKGGRSYYYLSALMFLLAGMVRPEYFAFVLPVLILVSASWRARLCFMLLAWSYPSIGALYAYCNKLRVPGAIRARDFTTLQHEVATWLHDLYRLFDNFVMSPLWIGLALAGLFTLAAFRTRFLSALLSFQLVLFLALYLAGRLEFNFPHYYLIHSIFFAVFASGFLVLLARRVEAATPRLPVIARRALSGIVFLLLIACLRPDTRYHQLVGAFSRKADTSAREMCSFIRANAVSSDGIILDYCSEYTWLWVELDDSEHSRVWHIGLNPGPAPILSVGLVKQAEDFRRFHDWIRKGFRENVLKVHPRWFITATDAEWERKKNTRHYQVSSLRLVLGVDRFGGLMRIPIDDTCEMELHRRYANERFDVYEVSYVKPSELQ